MEGILGPIGENHDQVMRNEDCEWEEHHNCPVRDVLNEKEYILA